MKAIVSHQHRCGAHYQAVKEIIAGNTLGRVHSAYKGFEIMMALCRSVTEGGQIVLPFASGMDELKELARVIPDRKVMLSMPENAKEYSRGT